MKEIEALTQQVIARTEESRSSRNNDEKVEFPQFRPGDVVSVAVRVVEGGKERIQNFEGIVLSRRSCFALLYTGPLPRYCGRLLSSKRKQSMTVY